MKKAKDATPIGASSCQLVFFAIILYPLLNTEDKNVILFTISLIQLQSNVSNYQT